MTPFPKITLSSFAVIYLAESNSAVLFVCAYAAVIRDALSCAAGINLSSVSAIGDMTAMRDRPNAGLDPASGLVDDGRGYTTVYLTDCWPLLSVIVHLRTAAFTRALVLFTSMTLVLRIL